MGSRAREAGDGRESPPPGQRTQRRDSKWTTSNLRSGDPMELGGGRSGSAAEDRRDQLEAAAEDAAEIQTRGGEPPQRLSEGLSKRRKKAAYGTAGTEEAAEIQTRGGEPSQRLSEGLSKRRKKAAHATATA